MHELIAALPRILVATTLSSSLAIAVVLLVRRGLRAGCGAGVAYAAWLLVPIALASVLLPHVDGDAGGMATTAAVVVAPIRAIASASGSVGSGHGAGLVLCWGVGLLLAAAWLAFQQIRFMRHLGSLRARGDGAWQADAVEGLPAAVGVLRPSVVVPADFELRFTPAQQALMLAHEHAHIVHGDLQVNACVAALRCLFWFNPLVHIAARALRQDQELACDARVIAQRPAARRTYAEAMFKTQVTASPLPIVCHWLGHPLKERIAMLKQPLPSSTRRIAGSLLVAVLTLGVGLAAWATQPSIDHVNSRVSVDIKNASILDAASEVARKAGLRLANPEVLHSTQRFTFQLVDEPLDKVLSLVGNAVGRVPQVANGEVRFAKPVRVVSDARMPPPAYPKQARKKGLSGHVMLRIDVAPDGRAAHVEIASAQPAGVFEQASLNAARSWTFEQRLEHGHPVAYQVMVPVTFVASETKGRM